MFSEKYGVIPKKCFPESHSSEASRRMNDILNHKVTLPLTFNHSSPQSSPAIDESVLTVVFLCLAACNS